MILPSQQSLNDTYRCVFNSCKTDVHKLDHEFTECFNARVLQISNSKLTDLTSATNNIIIIIYILYIYICTINWGTQEPNESRTYGSKNSLQILNNRLLFQRNIWRCVLDALEGRRRVFEVVLKSRSCSDSPVERVFDQRLNWTLHRPQICCSPLISEHCWTSHCWKRLSDTPARQIRLATT